MPAVEIVDLSKLFTRRERGRRVRAPALDGVTMTVARGECVAVLGQNGSGKSTLVRVLATLLLHERGHARVFGHDVAREERAVRRLVNRVSVEASFFKRLSATENLAYAARFYGLTPARPRVAPPQPRAEWPAPYPPPPAPHTPPSRVLHPPPRAGARTRRP